MSTTMPALVELQGVSREFRLGAEIVHAVREVDLRVEAGELLALVGPSGSGKSTVMNLIGLLDAPTAGEYRIDGRPAHGLSAGERALLRNRSIGFVFQQFHLLAHLSALDNVELPLRYRGLPRKEARGAALEALAAVGLSKRATHRPTQLSGGEKQRVAIARALAGRPRLLLADEPTGALDSATGLRVLDLLLAVARDHRAALVMITHDAGMARALPRRVAMRDGRIVGEETS